RRPHRSAGHHQHEGDGMTDAALEPSNDDTVTQPVTHNGWQRSGELPNAERQRLYRERQKLKKHQAAPANPAVPAPTPTADPRKAKAAKATQYQHLKQQADQAAREPAKRKPGAPSMYTDALGQEICERIAAREPLTKICEDEHMPCERQIYVWVKKYPEFAQE